jgi:hypothetical protein
MSPEAERKVTTFAITTTRCMTVAYNILQFLENPSTQLHAHRRVLIDSTCERQHHELFQLPLLQTYGHSPSLFV